MMVDSRHDNDDAFALAKVVRSDDARAMHVSFMGRIHHIDIVRVEMQGDGLPDLWVVPDGGVQRIFGKRYHPCLCNFFRELESRCASGIKFPLEHISLGEICQWAGSDKPFAELVDLILSRNGINRNE